MVVAVIPTPGPAPVLPAGWALSVTPGVRLEHSARTALRRASVRMVESVTTSLELVRDGSHLMSLTTFYNKKLVRIVFFRSLNPPTHKIKLVSTRTPLHLKVRNEMTCPFSVLRDGRELSVMNHVRQADTASSKVLRFKD